jgi:hypothetical protein
MSLLFKTIIVLLLKYIKGLLLCTMIFFYSFKNAGTGIIKGSIIPQDGAEQIIAVSSKDTLEAVMSFGNFQFNEVKPGSYILFIQARAPYKNYEKDDVVVSDGSFTDFGEITLEQ